jgi:hypothetical protein
MCRLGLQECTRGNICLKGYKYFHFIFVILQRFQGHNPKYRGGNVKGVEDEYVIWDEQGN